MVGMAPQNSSPGHNVGILQTLDLSAAGVAAPALTKDGKDAQAAHEHAHAHVDVDACVDAHARGGADVGAGCGAAPPHPHPHPHTTPADHREAHAALLAAAVAGDAAAVARLLAVRGVDANYADAHGGTALLYAAQEGHTAVVQALLRVAAIDPNHAGGAGCTALWSAAERGHAGCVRALLRADGVDVNRANDYGETPLQRSITYTLNDWEGCIRMLAAAEHVDINHCHPDSGRTALHRVCHRKHAALAAHLLVAGGCRFALTRQGETPLALALGHGAVRDVFASGVDYWRRTLHGRHAWAMKGVVRTVLLVRQRLDAHVLLGTGPGAPPPPHLPEEVWLAALGFLRSADFMPP